MIFNPDLKKQAQEVIFSRKLNKLVHPNLTFNNTEEVKLKPKNILDDSKDEHSKGVLDKIFKSIGPIRNFQPILLRFSFLTIYYTFYI